MRTPGADDEAFEAIVGLTTATAFELLRGAIAGTEDFGPFSMDPTKNLLAKEVGAGAIGYWCRLNEEGKRRKKGEKEEEKGKKKEKAKEEEKGKKKEKAKEKEKEKGKGSAGAGNVGFGISIFSTNVGAANAGVGVSVGSNSAAVGTAGAGISWFSDSAAAGARRCGRGQG
jgi:hypothetical protein